MNKAPYVRHKDYDHDDVDMEFKVDGALRYVANVILSAIVFALLMCAIAFLAQVPQSWLTGLILYTGGV
jgi:hypothetical protein